MIVSRFIFGRLSVVPAVTALIGTAPVRCFPNEAPQDVTKPYVVYEVFDGERHSVMGEDIDIVEPRISIHSWDLTEEDAENLSDQVRIALQRFTGTVNGIVVDDVFTLPGSPVLFDEAVDLFQSIRDYRVIGRE